MMDVRDLMAMYGIGSVLNAQSKGLAEREAIFDEGDRQVKANRRKNNRDVPDIEEPVYVRLQNNGEGSVIIVVTRSPLHGDEHDMEFPSLAEALSHALLLQNQCATDNIIAHTDIRLTE